MVIKYLVLLLLIFNFLILKVNLKLAINFIGFIIYFLIFTIISFKNIIIITIILFKPNFNQQTIDLKIHLINFY